MISRALPLFATLFALLACADKGADPATGSRAFLAELRPGESRLLLREFKAQGRIYGFDLYSVAEIKIEKDTLIEGSAAKAFSITAWHLYPETTVQSSERNWLAAQGDSLNLYRDKEGNASYLFGLLKRAAYDSSRFSDKTSEIVFPLSAGSRWLTRPPGGEAWSLEKSWTGSDTLEFDGRKYACDVFTTRSVVDLKSWVSSVGLLKAEIDFGPNIFTDTAGNELDTAQSETERYELLKLNPTPADVAAAKAKYKTLSWEKNP